MKFEKYNIGRYNMDLKVYCWGKVFVIWVVIDIDI